jgi:hypothetical protein
MTQRGMVNADSLSGLNVRCRLGQLLLEQRTNLQTKYCGPANVKIRW